MSPFKDTLFCPPAAPHCAAAPPAARKLCGRASGQCRGRTSECLLALTAYFCLSLLPDPLNLPLFISSTLVKGIKTLHWPLCRVFVCCFVCVVLTPSAPNLPAPKVFIPLLAQSLF